MLNKIIENIGTGFSHQNLNTTTIITLLLVVTILAVYEFIVYRFVSRKNLYNREFNLCIAVLPYFIATIIITLQSNLVITLGTIGALAIIRFRTAVKDPVDMIYLLWSIHIGITCGCNLYELAFITSFAVTIVLLTLNYVTLGKKPFVLVFHTQTLDAESKILDAVKEYSKSCVIKSRNVTKNGVDYVVELKTKSDYELTKKLSELEEVEKYSLVSYYNE